MSIISHISSRPSLHLLSFQCVTFMSTLHSPLCLRTLPAIFLNVPLSHVYPTCYLHCLLMCLYPMSTLHVFPTISRCVPIPCLPYTLIRPIHSYRCKPPTLPTSSITIFILDNCPDSCNTLRHQLYRSDLLRLLIGQPYHLQTTL